MSEYIDFKPGKEMEWLELNLLISGRPLTKSLIGELSGESEEAVDGWLTELELRSKLYTNAPYYIKSNRIIPILNWKEIPEYLLCVYYSFRGASDASDGTKLFEDISAMALKNFINGDVYALGFPASRGLNSFLDEIALLCNEERMIRADGSYKDDGVDVIGLKKFGDNRSASLYVLLQCAAGQNWTLKKKIELNRWTNYIRWYPENIILSISTVDYVRPKDWNKHSSSFGMLIDRLRIYNSLYENAEKAVRADLRSDLLTWCQTSLGLN
jgi:hypothetical protein